MGGIPVLWADYNTVDADGNPVDLSQREDTYFYTDSNGNRVEGKAKNYLTDEEAAEYTIKNVMSGDDNWQPNLLCEPCDAPVVTLSDNKLQWAAVPYAICYVVTCNGEVAGFTTDTYFDATADSDAQYTVQVVNEYGGLSAKAQPNDTTTAIEIPYEPRKEQPVVYYDLQGRRVAQPTRGIYITNGRKIVIK